MNEFRNLVERIPGRFIKDPPQGKHGKYVGHDDITQIALMKLGRPFSFEVVEVVYGFIPEWVKDGELKQPERPRGIIGVLGKLTVTVDGQEVTITEVGTANSENIHSDSENLKSAASDAIKRCWMRVGLGLELWVEQGKNPSKYYLPVQLDKDSGAGMVSGENPEQPLAGHETPASEYPPGEEPFE